MTHTATQAPANSWTIAYRKPRANKFHRVTNWCGTWEQARVMAGRFTERQDHEVQVYVVTAAEYEAWELSEHAARVAAGETFAPEHVATAFADHGNVMVDSGKRIRMTDTGTLPADLIAAFTVPAGTATAWHDMRTAAEEVAEMAAILADALPRPSCVTCGTPIKRTGRHEDGPWIHANLMSTANDHTATPVAEVAASIASAVPQPTAEQVARSVREVGPGATAAVLGYTSGAVSITGTPADAPAVTLPEPAGWNIADGETITVDGLSGEWVLCTEDEQPTNETTNIVGAYPKDPDHPHFCRATDETVTVDMIHRVVWPAGTKVSDYDELTGEVVADPHPEANPPGQAFVAVLWEGSTVPSVTLQSEVHRVL